MSRQPPLLRNPAQVEDAINLYPSIDNGGLIRRPGTKLITSMDRSLYYGTGSHFFKTTDGQRWVLLRRAEAGNFEVRNLDTGAPATLTIDALCLGYLQAGSGLDFRFLSIADTTLILNKGIAVLATEAAVPPLTAVYVEIVRTSSANQGFNFFCGQYGTAISAIGPGNTTTRDAVAGVLAQQISQHIAGLSAFTLASAPNVVKVTGLASTLALAAVGQTWDASAMTLIKGSVNAASKLPPVLEDGAVVAVDEGGADTKYYVKYDLAQNAWIECSYLPLGIASLTLAPNTLPLSMKQTGTNAFAIKLTTWTPRLKGDKDSNKSPFFVGKKLNDLAVFKARLVFACEDTLVMSQPDDLFNFFKETARESRPSDPVEKSATEGDVTVLNHLVNFNRNLIATSDNVQLEVDGSKVISNDTISIDVVTRYTLNADCRPTLVGDALYYAGIAEGRSALWEYTYDYQGASNTAFDLSKHIPDYIAASTAKIVGVPQAGRLFLTTVDEGPKFYTHTSYFDGQERIQNAWSSVVLAGVTNILDHATFDDRVFIVAERQGALAILSMQADVQSKRALAGDPLPLPFMDGLYRIAPVWNAATGFSTFTPPLFLQGQPLVVCAAMTGDDWWTEWATTTAALEVRVNADLTGKVCYAGIRAPWSVTFSPFYAIDGKSYTDEGKLHVHSVSLAFQRVAEVTAVMARPDRDTSSVQRGARVINGDSIRPIVGTNVGFRLPFNSQSNVPTYTVGSDSTAPVELIGYALTGRYTNVHTPNGN